MIKKSIVMTSLSLAFSLTAGSIYSQCEFNPPSADGLIVSGAFPNNHNTPSKNGKTGVAYFTKEFDIETGQLITALKLISSNCQKTIWTGSTDIEAIRGRVATIDADGDGMEDEIIAFHKNGTTTSLLCWYRNNNHIWSNTTIWSTTGYDADKITNRVVVGDFDNDGLMNDIAAFYDYGGFNSKIHVFSLNADLNSFSVVSSGIQSYTWYYQTSGYNCNNITGRMVVGDFDRDGYVDDIATLYDYGSSNSAMHVFRSNGSSITQSNPYWTTSGYTASVVTGTLVAGNFDKSGVFNHLNDDIVAFYNYGNGNVKAHYWKNSGNNSFNYSWKWEVSGFDQSKIRNRVFPFQEANKSPYKNTSAIAAYDYGAFGNKLYKWEINNSSNWNFNASINPFTCCSVFMPTSDEPITKAVSEDKSVFILYPNPTSDFLSISLNSDEFLKSVMIISNLGEVMNLDIDLRDFKQIDISLLAEGIYILRIETDKNLYTERIIKK